MFGLYDTCRLCTKPIKIRTGVGVLKAIISDSDIAFVATRSTSDRYSSTLEVSVERYFRL